MGRTVFVYRIGDNSGFYSEFNFMILAYLYCLENDITFKLYSAGANFAPKTGWSEFFLPFCKEVADAFHSRYNRRTPFKLLTRGRRHYYPFFAPVVNALDRGTNFLEQQHKRRCGVDFLGHDLLPEIIARYAADATAGVDFNLPAYNIHGDFQTISRFLIQKIYQFNPETESAVMKLAGTVALPDRYVGFQIRGGDKHYETSLRSVDEYIQRAERLTDIRHAFLSTDDYRLYENAVKAHPKWQFVTLCHPSEDGYDHLNFMAQPFHERKGSYYNLFTCMEILRKADLFVGTYSSNLGVFLGMCMEPGKCVAIDFDHFHYWWPE